MVTSSVSTACEREEAWFRLVDPVERCLVARLGCEEIELVGLE